VNVYEIHGARDGSDYFSVSDFNPAKATGGKWYYWWVENGSLKERTK